MSHAEIGTIDGGVISAEGSLDEIEKKLSDAARSGRSRFAWLTDGNTGQPVGVNPDHVVSLRPGKPESTAPAPGPA